MAFRLSPCFGCTMKFRYRFSPPQTFLQFREVCLLAFAFALILVSRRPSGSRFAFFFCVPFYFRDGRFPLWCLQVRSPFCCRPLRVSLMSYFRRCDLFCLVFSWVRGFAVLGCIPFPVRVARHIRLTTKVYCGCVNLV